MEDVPVGTVELHAFVASVDWSGGLTAELLVEPFASSDTLPAFSLAPGAEAPFPEGTQGAAAPVAEVPISPLVDAVATWEAS